ncbi:MAG: hypothetical protein PW845_18445 [Pseudomonas sp.]|uniref:hypothetical protein n=1 Tax=Pseudomonas abieticivorans TaxID=2931382 RepID=UPI0020BEF925|nr:hypothetical protein [Pseudomonas sp. PIA16]MDE1167294.1 hypothetical protein [Pseudomonas sp.]
MSVPLPRSTSSTLHRCAMALSLTVCVSLGAQAAQFLSVEPLPGHGTLHYYSSLTPGTAASRALIVLHGHPRDAQRTFEAGLATQSSPLVISPLFQVPAAQAAKCQSPGEPSAQPGDLLWSCGAWLAGAPASNAPQVTAFKAMDALIAEVHRQWPQVDQITLAGFSAGAQMVQHYIGFAAMAPKGVTVRYVVADPGTWLYFSDQRPYPSADCPALNQWKYGTAQLPDWLGRSAEQARAQYAAADIHYLLGELDQGTGKGTANRVLDRSCAAMAQGPYRLQRGQAYAQQDPNHPLTLVPGCAHDVRCVFPSAAARAAFSH